MNEQARLVGLLALVILVGLLTRSPAVKRRALELERDDAAYRVLFCVRAHAEAAYRRVAADRRVRLVLAQVALEDAGNPFEPPITRLLLRMQPPLPPAQRVHPDRFLRCRDAPPASPRTLPGAEREAADHLP